MTDLRADLIKAMDEVMSDHLVNMHSSVPISLPLGQLADAVLAQLADGRPVPRVPHYDQEMAEKRRWFSRTTDLAMDPPGVVGTYRADDLVVISTGTGALEREVVLPQIDAVELALNILSAAAGEE